MQSLLISLFAGIILMILGASFAYKFFQASVLGRITYWTGFLPFTIVSPFFTHLPASERSLIKTKQGLWIHMIMGPVFLVLAIVLLSAGADLIGWPGTDCLNFVLNGGDLSKPAAVIYDKRFNYSCPFIARVSKKLGERFDKMQIPLADKDKVLNIDDKGNVK